MRKILIVMAVLFVSLILFGCSGGQTTTGNNIYIGGTRGIEVSFITPFGDDTTGQDIIYEQNTNPVVSNPIDMSVQVQNEGEADVAAGDLSLKLIGIDESEFNNIIKGMTTQNAKTLAKIEPGLNYFDEQDISFQNPSSTQKIEFNRAIQQKDPLAVTVYACYKYFSLVSSSVCFRSSQNTMSTCNNIGNDVFSTSGAPIQITQVTQTPASDKVVVDITIKNVGSGSVYEEVNPAKTCDFGQDNLPAQNKVIGTVVSMGSNGKPNLVCDNPEVRLVNGVGTLRCWRTISSTDSYTEQITVRFDYQYEQTASHSFYIYAYNVQPTTSGTN